MKTTGVVLLVFALHFIATFTNAQQCNQVFSLGPDTTLPCNGNLMLYAPSGFPSYTWSNGSVQSQILVNQSGTYTCNSTVYGANIVTNGDFSGGNTGFTSGYIPGTGGSWGLLSNEGQYAVTANPILAHNNFASCFDHTQNNILGSMMVVNGAATPNVNVWQQTITVTPNTDYNFSFWGMTVVGSNPGQLQFSINGVSQGATLTLSVQTCLWQQFTTTWNSGNATSAVIAIANLNTSPAGNDFAIDDISFRSVCQYSDQIVVTIPPKPQFTTSPTQTICLGDTATITAQSNEALTYGWIPGPLTGSTIQVSPTASTQMQVIATNANNCLSDPKFVQINVLPVPQLSFTGDTLLCYGSSTLLTASSDIANTNFTWVNQNGYTLVVVPTQDTLITLIGTAPNGCQSQITIPLHILDELESTVSGTQILCEGQTGNLTVVSNLPNMTYAWAPMSLTGSSISIDHSHLGWVVVTGTHPQCGTTIDSIYIDQAPLPSLSVTPDLIVCPGSTVQLNASSNESGASFYWNNDNTSTNSMTLNISGSTYVVVYSELNGCRSETDTIFITMNPACDLEVPNVFTPNKDGTNDYFHLVSHAGITEFSCRIFNRWGLELQHFTKPDFQWDGSDKSGTEVSDGVYFYIIEAVFSSNEQQNKHGFIHKIK